MKIWKCRCGTLNEELVISCRNCGEPRPDEINSDEKTGQEEAVSGSESASGLLKGCFIIVNIVVLIIVLLYGACFFVGLVKGN
ncbi:MAG: hypothetical protein PHW04_00725 [Candidatus Wallbacteria bacterium]|nr:hypothetical protein [Candidatus Wallbacteria bacterium]